MASTMTDEEFETIDCTQPQKVEPSPSSYPPPLFLPLRYQRQGSILDHPSFLRFPQPTKTLSLPETIQPPSPPVTRTIPPFPLTAADFALVEGIDEGTYRAVKRARREETREARAARKKLRKEEGRKEVLRKVNSGWEVICVGDDEDDVMGDVVSGQDLGQVKQPTKQSLLNIVLTYQDHVSLSNIDINDSFESIESGRETSSSPSSSRTASGTSSHSNSTITLPDEPLPEPPFDASQVLSSSMDIDLDQPRSPIQETDFPASLEPNPFSNDSEDVPQISNESAQESETALALEAVKILVGRANNDNQDITMEQHPEGSSSSAPPTQVSDDSHDMNFDSDVSGVPQTLSRTLIQPNSDVGSALGDTLDHETSISLPVDEIDGSDHTPSLPPLLDKTNITQPDCHGSDGLMPQQTQRLMENANSTNISIQNPHSITVEGDGDSILHDPMDDTANTSQQLRRAPSSSSIDMPCPNPALIQPSSLPYPTHSQCTIPQSESATPDQSQTDAMGPASWINEVQSPFAKLGRGAPRPSRNHVALPKTPFSLFKPTRLPSQQRDMHAPSDSDVTPSDRSKSSKATNGYLPTPSPSPSPSKPSKINMQVGPPSGWTISKFYPS
ncbi:hypothetical protein I302_102755 [Kwoniella bestiolae CBS 10118]|uniref:Uncharacterized protein n=1 Tax=Kwoniella bestiolae CBS 10118 TaxID=1296100 RepID=A0A1B9GG56_9TREE|nr:hypothetical protein I302_01448 [Kwoniella bestiolae CBS 10118]OCF29935.1 hypothetical protein I302_01448 [Kwoniella bestiolae CBS 10118]